MPQSPAFAFSCVKTVPAKPCDDTPSRSNDPAAWAAFLLGVAVFVAILALVVRRFGSG